MLLRKDYLEKTPMFVFVQVIINLLNHLWNWISVASIVKEKVVPSAKIVVGSQWLELEWFIQMS